MQNSENHLVNLKHIVFVSREYTPSLRAGGIGSSVKEISEALAEKGFNVTVICASDNTSQQSTYVENAVTIIRLSGGDFYVPQIEKNPFFIKKLRFAYRFFSYRYKIRRTIQNLKNVSLIEVAEFGAEALFISNLKIPLIIRLYTPSLLNRKTGKIETIGFHNFHRYWIGLLEFYILKKANHITCCSDSLKQWFVQYLDFQALKIEVIYNVLNENSWSVDAALKKNLIEQPYIFFAGSIRTDKGVKDLIASVKILRGKNINIMLYLAGKIVGKEANSIVEQMQKENNNWCVFLNHLNRTALKMYYSKASVCCFPSYWENMPFVCQEAMASGCIVIGSSNGGMTEMIENGKNGFLCEPLNVPQLAQTIEKALTMSEKQRNDMSNDAITTIQTKFSKEVIINEMIDYYMLCTK